MNDDYDMLSSRGFMLIVVGAVILVLLVMNGTKPMQQAAPGYNGNTWQTEIHIEDNDTNVCVGFCPDR